MKNVKSWMWISMAALLMLLSHSMSVKADDLNPKCYELFEKFVEYNKNNDRAKAGGVANGMYYMKCWPALQDQVLDQEIPVDTPAYQSATDCSSLVPQIVTLINDQSHTTGYSVLQMADVKEMTEETRGRVSMSLIFRRIDPVYYNPFVAKPLSGTIRVLDCSAEARFTQGSYLIQMYLDRDSSGREFYGWQELVPL